MMDEVSARRELPLRSMTKSPRTWGRQGPIPGSEIFPHLQVYRPGDENGDLRGLYRPERYGDTIPMG